MAVIDSGSLWWPSTYLSAPQRLAPSPGNAWHMEDSTNDEWQKQEKIKRDFDTFNVNFIEVPAHLGRGSSSLEESRPGTGVPADASWWFARGTGPPWTPEWGCSAGERRFLFGSSRWRLPPLWTCLWSRPGQRRKSAKPDSLAPSPCRVRGTECVQVDSRSKIRARKKNECSVYLLFKIDVFEGYGVFY